MSNFPEKLADGYYLVRKSFEDAESQVGKYRVLANAKTKAEENDGYSVFTEDGICVYGEETAKTEALPTEEEETAKAEAVEETTEKQKVFYENDGNTQPILFAKLKTLMNIRKGNSLEAEAITTYKKGAVVPILQECSNGWLRVVCKEAENGYAYVSNENGQYAFTGRDVYTVVSADSLWKIAEAKLGDGHRHDEIRACNGLDSNIIRVGMQLLIP